MFLNCIIIIYLIYAIYCRSFLFDIFYKGYSRIKDDSIYNLLYSLYDYKIECYGKSTMLLHTNVVPSISYYFYEREIFGYFTTAETELQYDEYMLYLEIYGRPNILQCSFSSKYVKEKEVYGVVLLHYLSGNFLNKGFYLRQQFIVDAEIQSLRDSDKSVYSFHYILSIYLFLLIVSIKRPYIPNYS